MDVAKENAFMIRHSSIKGKGKGLSLQPQNVTPIVKKAALLRDVGNTLYSKGNSDIKKKFLIPNSVNNNSPFQTSYKSNSPLSKKFMFKTPLTVMKSNLPVPISQNRRTESVGSKCGSELKNDIPDSNNETIANCACGLEAEDMYAKIEIPEELKLNKDDIESLAHCWLKPRCSELEFSCSPVNTSYLNHDFGSECSSINKLVEDLNFDENFSPLVMDPEKYLRFLD